MRALIAFALVAIVAAAIIFISGGEDPVRPTAAAIEPSLELPSDQPGPAIALAGPDETQQREEVAQTAAEQPETMAPSASAKGSWGNAMRGKVVDSGGEAVGGAQLTLTLYGPGSFLAPSAEDRVNKTITADKDGSYSFENLHPDKKYTVIAYRMDVGRKVESNLTVSKGKVLEMDIVLEGGARFYGVVSDTTGIGIAGADLSLSYMSIGGEDTAGTLYVQSGSGGEYSFENVSEGTYDLTVTMEGFGMVLHRSCGVAGTEAVERNVTLDVAYLIEGSIIAVDGSPIEAATVEAHGKKSAEGAATRSRATTDETGHFSFSDIPRGSYSIVARAPGYRAGTARRISTGELNVTIQLEPEPSISGRVLDPTGAPLKDFTVQLRRRMANSEDTIPVPRQRFKVVDSEDGTYLLSCPNKGDYVVEAANPNFAPSFSAQVAVADGQRIENIDITMTGGGVIRGRLVDAEGPVAGARVQTFHTDFVVGDPFFAAMKFPGNATELEVTSAADGTFELPTLTPCDYQIHVISSTHAPLTQRRISISEGGEVELGDVTLSGGAKLTGAVSGPDGAGLSGVVVNLMLNAQAVGDKYGANYSTRTGSEGTYTFSALPPGPYQIYAQRSRGGDILSNAEDAQKTRREVTLVDGSTTRADFQLD